MIAKFQMSNFSASGGSAVAASGGVGGKFQFLLLFLFAAAAPPAGSIPLERAEEAMGRVSRAVLDNGMVCVVQEDRSAPVVSIQVWIGTGSVHEQEYLGAGLSHAIEHMLFKGTEARAPGEIARTIDDAGGSIGAYTSLDRTVFHVDIPSARWRTGLDVLADAVMNAGFPGEEWELEREVIFREMAMNRDDPGRELSRLLWQTAYMVHPHRVPVIGYREVFETITRSDLVAFFMRHYVPDNMIAAIAGDVCSSEAEAALREAFSGFRRRARAPVVLPREPAQAAPRTARAAGPYEISRLALGWHTVTLDHPDSPALDMLAAIAGRGRSSRLNREIRERRELAFTIGAYSFTPKEPGIFVVNAAFDPEKEADLIEAIGSEIEEWKAEPFDEEDLERARRLLLTSTLSEWQTMSGRAGSLASGEFYARDPGFPVTRLRRLQEVTPEEVRDAARRYLTDRNRTLVVLSPESVPVVEPEVAPAPAAGEVHKVELDNGLRLLVREDRRLPFVSVCAAFSGGLLFENEANNGITRLMSETMLRGTRRRSSIEIADAVESLGGSLEAFSGMDSFGLRARFPAGDAETFMEILSDCILRPAFRAADLNRQKAEQIAAIARRRESPLFLGMERLRETLFPGHPYRFIPEGSRETVEALTRSDVRAFHNAMVVAGNSVISFFGDITVERARSLAEKYLRQLPEGMIPAPVSELKEPRLPGVVERRAPGEQAIVLAGFPGVTRGDPRADALAVVQEALSGLSSDLLTAIRDERGLAYFAGAIHRPGMDPGMFVTYAGTREDAVDEVRGLMGAELVRLAEEGLREEEFERAVRQIVARHQRRLQVNAETALECALDELFGLGYEHAFEVEARMRALTPADAAAAAASILRAEKKAVSIVLPETGIAE